MPDLDLEATERTGRVLDEIARERSRQDAKWGEQNHPNGTAPWQVWGITGPAEWAVQQARLITEQRAEDGYLTWLDILREEVAEAFAEEDPAKLRAELVQVVAVGVAWIEAIDRRAAQR